jgi:predicted ester cyclase
MLRRLVLHPSFHTVCLIFKLSTARRRPAVDATVVADMAGDACFQQWRARPEACRNENRGWSFTMSTTTEQNKAVIRRFFDAWNARQPAVFDDLVAPDVVRHCEATPGVEARTLDQVKEFLRQDTAVFPDSVQTVKLLVAEENLVAAWTTYEGTQQGQMGPFLPSGRKAKFDFGAVFRIEGGKIAEWWVTWDNMTILKALGHLPNS